MEKYTIRIEPEAIADIQEIAHWYNQVQSKLGVRFTENAIAQINQLARKPQIYAIRYKEIRCMLINKFPFMVHFYINDENKTVEILAVIGTYRNPSIFEEKTIKSRT